MKTNLNIPMDKELKENVMRIADLFGVSASYMLRDTIENFMPRVNIPEDFITSCGISNIFKKGVPIRSILPFTSSMLGFNMVGDFTINLKGDHVKIDPYPTYSLLCGIKIVEQLYQTIRGYENGQAFNLGK